MLISVVFLFCLLLCGLGFLGGVYLVIALQFEIYVHTYI